MKRMILIIGLAAFGTGLPAQEAVDSLLTGDVQTDSLFQALPEVMVEGERPVVKALGIAGEAGIRPAPHDCAKTDRQCV